MNKRTLWLPRLCVRCGSPLEDGKQASAFFDQEVCRVRWGRARLVTRQSRLLAALEDRIKGYRQIACWYRLAIRVDGPAWHYPTTQRPSLRFDGIERATPGFLIHPYEPPVIPIRGEYYLLLSSE